MPSPVAQMFFSGALITLTVMPIVALLAVFGFGLLGRKRSAKS